MRIFVAVWALAHSFLYQSGIFLLILLQCFFPIPTESFCSFCFCLAMLPTPGSSFFTQLQHILNLFLALQSSAAYCCFVSFSYFSHQLPLISALVTGSVKTQAKHHLWHIRDELHLVMYLMCT